LIEQNSAFFFFFFVLPLAMPLVAGLIVLVGYGRDELNWMIGCITIKPVLAYPLWFYLANTVGATWYDNWLDNFTQTTGPLLPFLPAIILSIVIICVFRNMFVHRLAWLFLGLDILRMLNTFALTSSDFKFWSLAFGILLPSMIAILALMIVTTRNKTINSSLSALP
jgi:hypothetical protein